MQGPERAHEPAGVQEFFNANVQDYERKHYQDNRRSFMTVRQRRVLELVDALGLPLGAPVLDAGCGPGLLLEALAERGLSVSALDLSPEMLRTAETRLRSRFPGAVATFKTGTIEQLPYEDGAFDLVTSTGVVEYLETDARFLAEAARVLRPNGHLILPVTNRWSPVNCFDWLIEVVKRRDWFRKPFNLLWQRLGHGPLLPRHFHVRKHRPASLRSSLASAGFGLEDEVYFHFLPWPRPFDRLLPRPSAAIGEWMEDRLARSAVGFLGEGYLTRSRRIGLGQTAARPSAG